MKRSPLRRQNPERRDRLFRRQYHSDERVQWIRSLRCEGCGIVGYSQNAHTVGRARGTYRDIIPLCGTRPHQGIEGCHQQFDESRHPTLIRAEGRRRAERIHQLWEEHHGSTEEAGRD